MNIFKKNINLSSISYFKFLKLCLNKKNMQHILKSFCLEYKNSDSIFLLFYSLSVRCKIEISMTG